MTRRLPSFTIQRIRSDASSPFVRHQYWKAYCDQKYYAKQRGIRFLLTFEQWLEIWQASGRLEQRGNQDGQYVMARPGDRGPYAIGNVKIVTMNQNVSEGTGRNGHAVSEESRKRMSLRKRELSPLSEEQVKEIRRRYVYRSQHANSVTLAREYGVSQSTIYAALAGWHWKPLERR